MRVDINLYSKTLLFMLGKFGPLLQSLLILTFFKNVPNSRIILLLWELLMPQMHSNSHLFAHLHISEQTLNKYNYDQFFKAYDCVNRTQLNYQMQSLLILHQSHFFLLLMFLFLTLWSYFALCFLYWICVGKNLSVEISIYEATALQSILRVSHCMSCSLGCLWVS